MLEFSTGIQLGLGQGLDIVGPSSEASIPAKSNTTIVGSEGNPPFTWLFSKQNLLSHASDWTERHRSVVASQIGGGEGCRQIPTGCIRLVFREQNIAGLGSMAHECYWWSPSFLLTWLRRWHVVPPARPRRCRHPRKWCARGQSVSGLGATFFLGFSGIFLDLFNFPGFFGDPWFGSSGEAWTWEKNGKNRLVFLLVSRFRWQVQPFQSFSFGLIGCKHAQSQS